MQADLDNAGIVIRMATVEDLPALIKVGDRLFDYPLQPDSATEFFSDSRHHLVIAVCEQNIIGFASAVHYVHLDKQARLFINEVCVLPEYRNLGVATALIAFLNEFAQQLECSSAWLVTESSNLTAQNAYCAVGGQKDEAVLLYRFTFD
ncbi:GNAT family N-acetyltransferase [Neptunicella sp.]|uniref:GNAT family N-acetyltransferase n=1 Tax=Neptunicella sp. TaxID=2125986 RepID=UPI003F68D80B